MLATLPHTYSLIWVWCTKDESQIPCFVRTLAEFLGLARFLRFQSQVTFLGHKWENRFFAEAGRKKVCSFTSKEKIFLSDQGTHYLEIHWFPYN